MPWQYALTLRAARAEATGPQRVVRWAGRREHLGQGMQFTTRPTLQGTFGMVSSTHWLASQAAMAVLEDGGNAYDAAVAGAFVLHVVEPHLNGPAGERPVDAGLNLVHLDPARRTAALPASSYCEQ